MKNLIPLLHKLPDNMAKTNLLVIYNARVYTLNPDKPLVSALAIRADRIVAVGSEAETLGRTETNLTRIDLRGRVILPGLIDSHLHLERFARGLEMVNCETPTRQACLERVAEKARHTSAGEWICGHGWNQNEWPEGFGNAGLLDQATSGNNPVFLTAKSLHAAWVNSAALKLAGITPATPDPQGGKIERDAKGNPTGILLESAMKLVESIIPEPSTEQLGEMIFKALPALWKMGITAVHDFDPQHCFSALQMLHAHNRLKIRVVKNISLENLPHAVEVGLQSGFGDDFLRIGAVKLFADGALGPQSAAMLQPYEGNPGNTGMLFLDAEKILDYGRKAAHGRLSLAIHAIGDRANRETLKAFTQLRQYEKKNHISGLRHRIEHVQILHPDDIAKLAKNKLIASVQPIHATSDWKTAERFWGSRSANAYAYGALSKSGAILSFGSDAPVESPNPFWGLHAAVTRRRQDGEPGKNGWHPEQCLSLEDALKAYTTGPAYAASLENRQGCLKPGYWADFIILEEDPFRMPVAELFRLSPIATMIAGEWVWRTF